MTKHFQSEIERLKKRILLLAAMVEENLQKAVRAVAERDTKLAGQVIDGDPEIDMQEVEVEEDCLKILALHQPVAADLRYVVAVLKINNDLERIADLAVNIAERSIANASRPAIAAPFDVSSMVAAAVKLVRDSVDSLVKENAALAHQVILDDDIIDDFHRTAYRTVQDRIKSNPDQAELLISFLSVSRNLERIADHATNIAEDVIYMIEGEIVRHGMGRDSKK
ncbi:MAG: phosphate signaling complex protein PhoU [candidate division Zixibacteria bacterium]|jgi:phosphate transport system protein|nr:phosphate signaling complex protein PhoU [candidate division Zixibacteria bacterium]